ncbi:MAG: O-acetyl-ADP-ribose deacetylase [Planctomycetes bacterium]|nr:O-acetyl-ADP-ribose deacetylase [Planctomycetota bacterium]
MSGVIEAAKGDITTFEAEAIANAANAALAGGGGVDGAIHRAGGPDIMKELRARYPKGCPTGSAVGTGAGRLKAKWIFHAVGPRYRGRPEDARLLAGAYGACLRLAVEKGARTIAFPSISTGVYGYPLEEAAPIAVGTVREFMRDAPSLQRATFVLFDDRTYEAFERALRSS